MRKPLGVSLLMLALGCAHAPTKDTGSTSSAESSPGLSALADQAYDAENFATCAELRLKLAESLSETSSRAEAYYNAAACASLGGDLERAMTLLRSSADQGYLVVDQLQHDPELAPLHAHAGWTEVVARVAANHAKAEQPPMPIPVLESIDISRSRRADPASVTQILGLKVGQPIIRSRHLMKQREKLLRERFNLAYSNVAIIAFFAEENVGKAFASVDLVDAEDSQRLNFRPTPTGNVQDPEGLLAQWQEYEDKVMHLVKGGHWNFEAPPSCRVAHCAFGFGHPDVAAYEPRFVEKAPGVRDALLRVLSEDANADRRASVPYVLGYAGTPEQVIAWLVPFFRDPHAGVRNNVIRSVLAFQTHLDRPVVDLKTVFDVMEMPNATDRNKGTFLLEAILQKLNPDELKTRRTEVLQKVGVLLVDMTASRQPIKRDPAVSVLKLLSGEGFETPAEWRQWLSRQRF
ncbi:hypothetical protein [Myxococcus stipitatus]|uniref:hypothetical protein n=1 Tax=Myxococcus stipitatus TaxID=83455 RepID=UPI0030D288B1